MDRILDCLRHFRHAVRALVRRPGFTLTAALTLALGIGATTLVFAIFDAVLLRPLPFADPDHLYVIHEQTARGGPEIPVNALHFRAWGEQTRSFDGLALLGPLSLTLTGRGDPIRLPAARATPNLFRVLGVEPVLGRAFLPREDVPGRDDVVILGYRLWKDRFGADPGIVGRTVTLDGSANVVVGVLPARFSFSKLSRLYAVDTPFDRPQLFKPFAATARDLRPLGGFDNIAIARLSTGVSVPAALAELNSVQARLARAAPEPAEFYATLVPMARQIVARSRTGVQLAFITAALVLLVTCVNISGLMLTRAERQRRGFAIRSAAGATRGRLVLQALTESLVVSALAGVVAIAAGAALIRLVGAAAPVDLPRIDEVSLSAGVLLFAAVVTVATGLLVGVIPALHATRTDALRLRAGPAAPSGAKATARLRSVLVGLEVAASAACLVFGAVLLVSYVKLMTVNRGFTAEHVVTMDLALPAARYDRSAGARFLSRLEERTKALPGVGAAGVTDVLPLGGSSASAIMVEGTNRPRQQRPLAMLRIADRGYFDTLGIALQAGRLFDEDDAARRVALVSERAASRLWPGQDPIGKRFRFGADDSPWIEVVGVVNDVRAVDLGRAPPLGIYLPIGNFYGRAALVARAEADPTSLAVALRETVRELDPMLAVPTPRALDDIVEQSLAPRKFQMDLMLVLGGITALLAGIGIYGTLSYAVAQRLNELGIRVALGAHPGQIRGLVLAQALVPVAAGLACGFAAAAAAGGLLGNLLFGVSATQGSVLAAVGLLLGTVAFLASDIPARRATRADPMAALRAD